MVHRNRRRGVATEVVLAASVTVLFIAAELALILRVPLPSILPRSAVAIVRAATGVSFAAIADYFLPDLAGRAKGASKVLHFGRAFLVQYATDLILEQWSTLDGHKSILAYQAAFGLNVVAQIAASLGSRCLGSDPSPRGLVHFHSSWPLASPMPSNRRLL